MKPCFTLVRNSPIPLRIPVQYRLPDHFYVFPQLRPCGGPLQADGCRQYYGRLTNSTQDVLEKRLAALEGGVAALGSTATNVPPPSPIPFRRWPRLATTSWRRRPFTAAAITWLPAQFGAPYLRQLSRSFEVENGDGTKAIYLETLGISPNSVFRTISCRSFQETAFPMTSWQPRSYSRRLWEKVRMSPLPLFSELWA